MKFLVTGGAGYIGSHMANFLKKKKHEVVILDNFSTGKKQLTNKIDAEIMDIDLRDKEKLNKKLLNRNFDAVFHFAARSIVPESFKKKIFYYQNNVIGTKNLFKALNKKNLKKIIFSSTAAVYAKSNKNQLNEKSPVKPLSPYGKNKLEIENFLNIYSKENKITSFSFRYFNACGADFKTKIGEFHTPETHLIPKLIDGILLNKKNFFIFGNNHPTHDGTCVRDYVHVNDIVEAHYKALFHKNNNKLNIYNIGSEKGYSVLEIFKSVERITKRKINLNFTKKRKGDLPKLIASCSKIKKKLNWKQKYSNIDLIIRSALKWHLYKNRYYSY